MSQILRALGLRSDHADPNLLALTFWILLACILSLFLCRERFRQRREFTTNVLEKQPSLGDFGHQKFIAQPSPHVRNITV
jgi:hypothetical protein